MTDAATQPKPAPTPESERAKRVRPMAAAGGVEQSYTQGQQDGKNGVATSTSNGVAVGNGINKGTELAKDGAKATGEFIEEVAEGGLGGIWGKIKGFFANTNGGGLAGSLLGGLAAWVIGGFFGGEGMLGTVISALLIPAGIILGRQFGNETINQWFDKLTGNDSPERQPQTARSPNQGIQANGQQQQTGAALPPPPQEVLDLARAVGQRGAQVSPTSDDAAIRQLHAAATAVSVQSYPTPDRSAEITVTALPAGTSVPASMARAR